MTITVVPFAPVTVPLGSGLSNYSFNGSGTLTCSGTITTTWTWTPDFPGEVAPYSVMAFKTVTTPVSDIGGFAAGADKMTGDNGNGLVVTTPITNTSGNTFGGGLTSSVPYVQNVDANPVLTWTDSLHFVVTFSAGRHSVSASVGASWFLLEPLAPTLTGIVHAIDPQTGPDPVDHILVGQACTGSQNTMRWWPNLPFSTLPPLTGVTWNSLGSAQSGLLYYDWGAPYDPSINIAQESPYAGGTFFAGLQETRQPLEFYQDRIGL
jgi:hypothetical protein